jgi:glycosyltransferase involved in cell wall biosynthesis
MDKVNREMSPNEPILVLFLSFAFSLEQWAEEGFFDREIALYNEHADEFDQIYLVTYGTESDLEYEDELAENVHVLPKRYVSNNALYSVLAPFVHYGPLSEANVVKSEQMLGSWTAVVAKYVFRLPLLVRTGYVLSIFYDRQEKPLAIRYVARLVELISYKTADGVISSSPRGYQYVEKTYSPPGIHRMIPNYIETDVFEPMSVSPESGTLCFVGRLAPQKNLFALLEALASLPYSLTVIGSGEQSDELGAYADQHGVDVSLAGTIPNHELPAELNRHEAFILPSLYEGMPKSLLEAMSCGLPVIGTDVVGINEVVDGETTGILCDTDAESIREAITTLMNDAELQRRLGTNAREEIVENYSLAEIARRERTLIGELSSELDVLGGS